MKSFKHRVKYNNFGITPKNSVNQIPQNSTSPQERKFLDKQGKKQGNSIIGFLRRKAKIIMPFLIAPAIYFANPKDAKSEFYVSGGYECNFLLEKQGYTTDLTNKLRDGTITQEPTSNVSDVKPATFLGMPSIEAGYGIKLNEDLILWLNGGYAFGKTNTSYSANGHGDWGNVTIPITRTEENNFSKAKIGAKLEKEFKNFALGVGVWLDFYNINHKANLTWTDFPYTQWRDYSATGQGIGASVEGEFCWKPVDWFALAVNLGYNFGKVDMKGEELWKDSSSNVWKYHQECNPALDLNGLNLNLKASLIIK